MDSSYGIKGSVLATATPDIFCATSMKGQAMGLLDNAKKLASENADKVEAALDQAEKAVNDKTDGKYSEQVKKASDVIQSKLTGE